MQKNSGTDSDTLRAQDPQNIRIADYGYELPDERIAKFPLQDRDLSKLLVFDSRNIRSDVFANLPNYLPSGSCLVFNNSKVIQARLVFQSPTGAEIEVFCLEPVVESMGQSQGYAEWKCFVGNAKR
ncbi:MAG: S-adenosylmethionine:tRNA ribosyltransferase-isomerase, partial [Cytophagales bacterium]|nr:S-adenosylmethionine:tRNA ribosyltransferase-isomerase [Cytophagales bacterium]